MRAFPSSGGSGRSGGGGGDPLVMRPESPLALGGSFQPHDRRGGGAAFVGSGMAGRKRTFEQANGSLDGNGSYYYGNNGTNGNNSNGSGPALGPRVAPVLPNYFAAGVEGCPPSQGADWQVREEMCPALADVICGSASCPTLSGSRWGHPRP